MELSTIKPFWKFSGRWFEPWLDFLSKFLSLWMIMNDLCRRCAVEPVGGKSEGNVRFWRRGLSRNGVCRTRTCGQPKNAQAGREVDRQSMAHRQMKRVKTHVHVLVFKNFGSNRLNWPIKKNKFESHSSKYLLPIIYWLIQTVQINDPCLSCNQTYCFYSSDFSGYFLSPPYHWTVFFRIFCENSKLHQF